MRTKPSDCVVAVNAGTPGIAEALTLDQNSLTVRSWPPSQCIHQLFEAQAARTPEAMAVVFGEGGLSYRELNERANQLAHHLRSLGVAPGVLVGICLDRVPDLVVGILGILKAGGAYLPLDLAYPRDRVTFILRDAEAPIVVTQSSLVADLASAGSRLVCLDTDWTQIQLQPLSTLLCSAQPADLAYVIYTSGSTGKPKGSLISHYNVVRLFQSTEAWFHFSSSDVWTLFHSCAFDFSVWELWGALLYGGRLVVVPFSTSRTPEAFYRLLCDHGVTVLNQTPSAFRQLVRAEESAGLSSLLSLRWVIFGGEALDMKSLKPWFDRHGDQVPRLVNMYGITETTVHVTYRPLRAEDVSGASVIGVPLPDLQVYLLDEEKRPVPSGSPGEIYVSGAGVGRGYLRREELTADRFLPNPFCSEPSASLYRSGDLGRYLPNGDLEYLGRIDHQVKIHGFRIELGEIESVINAQPGVRETVVLAREDEPGNKMLVAYVIKAQGAEVSIPMVRQALRGRLPEYMMPAAFLFIDHLPLTVNGKLDPEALPAPNELNLAESRSVIVAPETQLQRDIASIWQDLLRLGTVSLDDNFFDLGGNSILMGQVHTRLEELLKRPFSITDLFTHATIRTLAEHFGSIENPGEQLEGIQERARRRWTAMRAPSVPRPPSSQ